ncbi:DUF1820 family protein [Legionella sp. CNM-4043-24]|uniref:DUF1820 family protein n=1 Tax=Legionella sp. CNM-4043-24 TaxID=3421646 RepID=UPI00403B1BD6
MSGKMIYRVTFANQESIYELFARKVCESEMFGFLEVEEFVFGENTSLVVDPSEERLKTEFKHVKRTFIPMHSVYRIDEVSKEGAGKIRDKSKDDGKVSMFPVPDRR